MICEHGPDRSKCDKYHLQALGDRPDTTSHKSEVDAVYNPPRHSPSEETRPGPRVRTPVTYSKMPNETITLEEWKRRNG